jgi:TolB-like protein/Flp pilus assembly protein TadD
VIDRVVSHYRILEKLGAGGMGEVYLAEDTRLGRNVAIKVLPEKFTWDPGRLRRFEQEARAASALNHPNIITIYDIGQSDDVRFIVTEFIEGETLRRRLLAGRPSVHEALRISIQVAEALAAAHHAGIIHRDIKPENVMLRGDGYVKVLDFGLAKLTERPPQRLSEDAPTAPRIETEPGQVMGTVRYMSPEQARGVGVEAPTDIFSLGVVMYEMISGRPPFQGATATDIIVSILQTDPPPLSTLSSDVPAELERIVARALAKDRNERYQTADEMAGDLKRLKQRLEVAAEMRQGQAVAGGVAAAPLTAEPRTAAGRSDSGNAVSDERPAQTQRRRIPMGAVLALLAIAAAGLTIFLAKRGTGEAIDTLAVLPFMNASADENGEYLSDGITESLINSLSQLPNLKVMSRSAVWRYKTSGAKAPPDVRSVGRDLNVRAVLTGRVATRGDRLQISAELVDTRDNSHLWGEQYDRSRSDVLSVQEEIASEILERLRVKLSGQDKQLVTRRYTENTAAYERYIRGRYFLNRRSADSIRRGRDFFREAIEEDPAYALAYSGLSDSYALLAAQAALAPAEAYPAALAAARKAIELDPALAEGHASLAHAEFHMDDFEAAEREFGRAIELKPNYVPAYQWRSEFLLFTGRGDEALASSRKALAIDPLDLAANAQMGAVLIGLRRYDEAIQQLRKTQELDPDFFQAHALLGRTYMETGRFPEAIAEFKRTTQLTGGNRGPGGTGLTYAMAGRADEARLVLEEMKSRAREHYVDPMEVAQIGAALHDKEETLIWLAKVRLQNPRAFGRIGGSPEFTFLRADPRFIDLTRSPAETPGNTTGSTR